MLRVLSFDCESNGLHGEAFAIGATVLDEHGGQLAAFEARCPIAGPVDQWVAENVLPACAGLPELYPDARSMRDAFWRWWLEQRERHPGLLVVGDCGWPVEARLLAACVDDSPERRAWQGPQPMHELATMFLLRGLDPWNTPRLEYAAPLLGPVILRQHDPTHDALASGLCAVRLLRG